MFVVAAGFVHGLLVHMLFFDVHQFFVANFLLLNIAIQCFNCSVRQLLFYCVHS